MSKRTVVWLAATMAICAALVLPGVAVASTMWPNDSGQVTTPPVNGVGCLTCHGGGLGPTEDFTVPNVNYATACLKCHQAGFVGTHPYHNAASGCGTAVCHRAQLTWGGCNLSEVPAYAATSGATFAGPSSLQTTPGVLHTIHEQAGWMANVTYKGHDCRPCHNAASCTACHAGAIASRHAQHSTTTSSVASTKGVDWAGVVDDGTTMTVAPAYHCGNSMCHNIRAIVNDGVQYKEDSGGQYSPAFYPAQPANNAPEDTTVTITGTWSYGKSGNFTNGWASGSNYPGSTRTVWFTGTRIQVVAEKDPFLGYMDISVDGGPTSTVDLYDPLTRVGMVVYDNDTIAPGRHYVTVGYNGGQNVASRGNWVIVDQFRSFPSYTQSIANSFPYTCASCHTSYVVENHNPASSTPHYYSTRSDYSESVITSGTGCSNSGAGCHGTDSLAGTWYPDVRTAYHSDAGCGVSGCHQSTDMHNVHAPMDCVKCHAVGAFNGAVVATPLAGIDSAGHYGQLTHAMVGSMYVNTTSTPATMGAGGSANARCVDCHPAIKGVEGDGNPDYLFNWHQSVPTTMHATGVKSLKCVGCHNDTLLGSSAVVHSGTATTCQACHGPATQRAMHATATAPVVTATSPQGCASGSVTTSSGPGCHASTDLHTLHRNSPKGCALTGCHNYTLQASVPTMTSCGLGGQCHTTYTTFTGHSSGNINGNDTTHTARSTDMTADCTGGLYTAKGNKCVACHTTSLQSAHTSYTASLESGNTSWGVGPNFCTQCHNTSVPDNSVYVIKQTNWQASKHCSDCHNAAGDTPPGNGNGVHTTMSTVHTATVGTPGVADGCAANGCHNTLNVMAIHNHADTSATINYGCDATQSVSGATADDAFTCHGVNKLMLKSALAGVGPQNTAMACGQGSGGCHTNHTNTNHGVDHAYSAGSNYANTETVGVESGCMNAGGGCHGNDATYGDFGMSQIHFIQSNGVVYPSCSSSSTGNLCHTSPSKTQSGGWNGGHECVNCHGGPANASTLFTNAYGRSFLTSTNAQGGHYNDTSHTASGIPSNTVMTEGGSASAMCKDCHYGTLRNQHENLQSAVPPGGTAHYGSRISCGDCHSDVNVGGLAAVTASWNGTNNHRCAACHAVGVGTAPDPQHALGAQVETGTSTQGCAGSGVGCHTSDLHAIHANIAGGCFVSAADGTCHVKTMTASQTQAVRPARTCGSGGGACHGGYSGLSSGHANGTITGNEPPTHTATNVQGNVPTFTAYQAGLTCSSCHYMQISFEHMLSTSATSTNANPCLNCHLTPTNIPATVWAPTRQWISNENSTAACGTCHNASVSPTMAPHPLGENAATHTVPTNAGCGNTGPGCHPTNDISSVYASYPTTQTGIHKTCLRCHDYTLTGRNMAYNPVNKGCGDSRSCHGSSNYDINSYVHTTTVMGVINGTDPTHTASGNTTFTTSYVQTGTASVACSDCHSQTLAPSHAGHFPGVGGACVGCHDETSTIMSAQLIKNGPGQNWNPRKCESCHSPAQGGTLVHAALSTTATHTATSPLGCANSGAGCHTTANLMTLHKNRVNASGCVLSGCHDAAHKDSVPTMTACGSGSGGCHLNYTMTSHPGSGITGDDATHTASHATTQATSMFATATADGTAVYDVGGGNQCPDCHYATLQSAHTTYTATLDSGNPSWTVPPSAAFCQGCHNTTSPDNAVTVIKTTGWPSTSCDECHGKAATGAGYGNGRHASFSTSHTASMGTAGIADACNTCHSTTDVLAIHNKVKAPYSLGCGASDSGKAKIGGTDDDGYTCHDVNKIMLKQAVAGVGATNTAMACGQGSGGCHYLHNNSNHGAGGGPCFNCHGATSAEDLSLMATSDPMATSFYHHAINGTQSANATLTGDYYAPYSVYPTDQTNGMYCISCHVDHAKFSSPSLGANLRTSVLSTSPNATNTDFIQGGVGGTYGVCLGCHNQTKAKNLTYQETAQDQSAFVVTISPQAYDVSAHQYSIVTSFSDGSTFLADCVKCHDDNSAAGNKETSAYKLASHFTTESRLLSALGATTTGSGSISSYNLCFKCHGRTTGAAAQDGYGAVLMTAPAANVRIAINDIYTHPVTSSTAQGRHDAAEFTSAPALATSATTNGWWGAGNAKMHTECEDCHNPHAARSNVNTPWPDAAHLRSGPPTIAIDTPELAGVWGVTVSFSNRALDATGNWAGSGAFGSPKIPDYSKVASATYEWQVCLKCHGRYAWGTQTTPTAQSGAYASSAIGAPLTDVGRDFDPANYAIHPLFAMGKNQPGPGLDANWNSSAGRRLVGGVSTNLGLTNTFVDGWQSTSRVTCGDCHGADSWAATATAGPHGSSNRWLVRGLNTGIKVTFAGGSSSAVNVGANAKAYCLNCHRADVYGTGTWSGAGTATYASLSRLSHLPCSSCWGSGYVLASPGGVATCNECHGGRPAGNIGTANGGATGGYIHGSSAPLNTGSDAQGYRFMNGADWAGHTLGDTSGNGGCYTLNGSDSFGNCTRHSGGANFSTNYYYAKPTQ